MKTRVYKYYCAKEKMEEFHQALKDKINIILEKKLEKQLYDNKTKL